MSQELKFELKQIVTLIDSGEVGTVISRCESSTSEPSYLIRYKAADGRQVEAWCSESALEAM
jgi:hypothetical protein